MTNFAEKFAKQKSATLQKLAKVKTGEELEAIIAVLTERGEWNAAPAESGDVVYQSDEPISADDEAALDEADKNEGKAPKAKKEKTPKGPRPLKKQISAEQLEADIREAKKNIGRIVTFMNAKTKSEATGVVKAVRVDKRSNSAQYFIAGEFEEGFKGMKGKEIHSEDLVFGEMAPVAEKPKKEQKAKKEKTEPVCETGTAEDLS